MILLASVIALLLAANGLLGGLIWRALAPARHAGAPDASVDWPAAAFASLGLGVAATGWLALLLAELGFFTIGRLAALWALLAVFLAMRAWYAGGAPSRAGRSPTAPAGELEQGGAVRRPAAAEEVRPAAAEDTRSGRSPTAPASELEQGGAVRRPAAAEGVRPAAAEDTRAGRSPTASAMRLEMVVLGIWLIAAVFLYFRPHEYVLGGADAGVYVNLGAAIAQHGGILIQDETLAALDPGLYPALLRAIPENPVAPYYLLPAFYVVGAPPGEITPQFYPLHPVWQAVAYGLAGGGGAGVRAELLLTGLWALLGALGIYFTVRAFAGRPTAMLALAGLSINALQIWFARYPTAEALTQYLLWAGLWGLGLWWDGRFQDRRWGLLAGLLLGQLFLVRIDALFVLPIFGLLLLWLWLRDGWRRVYAWFWAPLAFMLAHSLLHALWQSRPYFFELFGYGLLLLRVYWGAPLAGALLGLALLALLLRCRTGVTRLWRRARRPLLLAAIAGFVAWAGHGWFIRPFTGQPVLWNDAYSTAAITIVDHENWRRLGWYLAPLGVWLGAAGIGLLLWRVERRTAVFLAVGLLFTLLYLTNVRANPHHMYVMRRYVPAVMPLFVIGAAQGIGWLGGRPVAWRRALALLLAMAWLGGLAWSGRDFVSQVDHRGLIAQLDGLDAALAPEAALIFNDSAPVGVGDFVGTPLKFLYGRDVFKLHDPAALDDGLLRATIAGWQAAGRTVYWVGAPDWLDAQGLAFTTETQTLTTQRLEGVYDRKPRAILTETWRLDLYRLASE